MHVVAVCCRSASKLLKVYLQYKHDMKPKTVDVWVVSEVRV